MTTSPMYPRARKAAEQDRRDAVEQLRKLIKPGDTIHTIIRQSGRSGMRRRISPIIIDSDGDVFSLDAYAARALQWSRADQYPGDGVVVDGCGMDMGFHLVYTLSRVVFGESVLPLTGVHRSRVTRWVNQNRQDVGYALRHRWL